MNNVVKSKFLKITPRKLRGVINLVRGKNINKAIAILTVTKKRGCFFVERALKNAVANMQNNSKPEDKVDTDSLYIKEAFVDEGPSLKRWLPRAMGRATEVKKRMSHLTIKLEEKKINKK
jgi:large subunit ribosomal protein L22